MSLTPGMHALHGASSFLAVVKSDAQWAATQASSGPTREAMQVLTIVCAVGYTVAWVVSFFPQIWLNHMLKTGLGISRGNALFSTLGFACYFVYNVAAFAYESSHDVPTRSVQWNDVAFATCAFSLSVLQNMMQPIWYDGWKAAWAAGLGTYILCSVSLLFVAVNCVLALAGVINGYIPPQGEGTLKEQPWSLVAAIGWVKVPLTVIKYAPQAWQHYQRKSCEGWSLAMVILDFSGGFLSLMQGACQSMLDGNTDSSLGNPEKMSLSACALLWNFVLFYQLWRYGTGTSNQSSSVGEGGASPNVRATRRLSRGLLEPGCVESAGESMLPTRKT